MSDRDSARQRIEQKAIADFEAKPRDTGVRRTGPAYRGETHTAAPTERWLVVVPVKGTPEAKSRLQASPELALAIALDTIDAAVATPGVVVVVAVTSAQGAPALDETEAFVIIDEGQGLDAAIRLGLETAAGFGAPGVGTAVLLGDLPALQPAELAAALEAARAHPLAMVPDAEGTGTTLVTAADGVALAPAFGAGSAAAHRALGHVVLPVSAESGLRRDVDTAEDLAALEGRLGPRTTGSRRI